MKYNKVPIALSVVVLFIVILANCSNNSSENSTQSLNANSTLLDSINVFKIDKKYLLGQFNPANDTNFIEAENKYANANIYLRQEVYDAFVKMADAARIDGVNLFIVSGTRTFERQKVLWENKWNSKTKNLKLSDNDSINTAISILKYSAMPGTSRHHWGTDIDINSTNTSYFKVGDGLKVINWLENNAYKYNFCRPYTAKNEKRKTGHEEEYWHWSYAPLSKQFLNEYLKIINYEDLKGFKAWQTAKQIDVIEKYIKGVNIDCL